jgi:hypothetical protein
VIAGCPRFAFRDRRLFHAEGLHRLGGRGASGR